jgi:hypothetical protein
VWAEPAIVRIVRTFIINTIFGTFEYNLIT